MRITLTTASAPGAIAIVQLTGDDPPRLLMQLTDRRDWPLRRLFLVRFADIDEGLACLLTPTVAQLMPHGGPRVVQKLLDHCISLGATYDPDPAPRDLYPEADSDLEADMLAAMATAASPAAVDRLAKQPVLWRSAIGNQQSAIGNPLDHLLTPPTIVVVGRPNVGKSTLTNRMIGRAASIVADLPGTTRDWVGGVALLDPGIAVNWLDTPGLRGSDDPIEKAAIELARQVITSADVLIAMRDPVIDWPEPGAMPRTPDLWVVNKADTNAAVAWGDGRDRASPLAISAQDGRGVDRLSTAVLDVLQLSNVPEDALWAFSPTLRRAMSDPSVDLTTYCEARAL